MIGTRREIGWFQSTFYRDAYYKVLRWLLVEAVIMLGLIIAILYCIFSQPVRHYYIATASGQIMPLAAQKG